MISWLESESSSVISFEDGPVLIVIAHKSNIVEIREFSPNKLVVHIVERYIREVSDFLLKFLNQYCYKSIVSKPGP